MYFTPRMVFPALGALSKSKQVSRKVNHFKNILVYICMESISNGTLDI